MKNRIDMFRQPMVTTTGILLGFILNFAITWISTGFDRSSVTLKDKVIGFCICACTGLLIVVLYRILNIRHPDHEKHAEEYYQRTLMCFIAALLIAFGTIVGVMLHAFITAG